MCYLLDWKPFKNNDEKYFLFHLKNSFCSQGIYVFVTTFWSCGRNGLIKKIWLTWKFMTAQPGLQTITIHILPNTHKVKATRQWNLVNWQNITRKIVFFKNYAENEAGRLVPDLFLFFEKAQNEVKSSGLQLIFR